LKSSLFWCCFRRCFGESSIDSSQSKAKWDRIYTSKLTEIPDAEPSLILSENRQRLPKTGRALDVACGRGSNAIYLATLGLKVDAWDISSIAVNDLNQRAQTTNLSVSAETIDITPVAFAQSSYNLIAICHYLDRDIIPAVRQAIAPGGLLCMQTFTRDKRVNIGPTSLAFLLGPDELLDMVKGFEVLSYRDEGPNPDENERLAGRAYVVARKPLDV
jgi:tellurite methyltransferase